MDADVEKELQTTVAARRELGPTHDEELIQGFLERIERRLERAAPDPQELKRRHDHQKEMILGGMAISIPLLAIAGGIAGLPGIAAVCAVLIALAIVASRS